MKSLFFVWQIILLGLTATNGFAPHATNFPPITKSTLYSIVGDDGVEYEEQEITEMRELILSLSKEPTDHDRRMRLKAVFHEALDRPNGMPKRFTDLFGILLTQIGEEVQMAAKKAFFEAQEDAEQGGTSSTDDDEPTSKQEEQGSEEEMEQQTERVKSQEELQLWALVDMMVQSKTIVKKANGELGSKGSFQ